ncbi:MAG TPA: nuclear transport factor 2 family protein [Frankiaceae bacterium]|jgi:3-phenylpropionate/cinnamic acid dioxygenase small subunit|nr:nuclear transport factor 2 family protein [Frankiaceae bacterium]
MNLQQLQDKIEIQELLARYARGLDTKDWEVWRAVFTADAVLDYSSAGIPVGTRDEVGAIFEQAFVAIPWAQHFITNIEIDLDGDQAKVRAMFYNPMQLPGADEQSACGGTYHHDMVRTADGWKSEKVVESNMWFVNPPGAGAAG